MLWAKLFVLLLEWGIQLKRRDDHEKRQERLQHARSNPGDYLRQFGRVRRVADKPTDAVSGDTTGTEGHDRD